MSAGLVEKRKLSLYHSRGDDIVNDECGFCGIGLLVYGIVDYGFNAFSSRYVVRLEIVAGGAG